MALSVESLSVSYGNVSALWDVSMSIEQREIVSLIGANGAGKSTLLKAIMGLVKLRGGSVILEGKSIGSLSPHSIVSKGVAYVPEGRRLFSEMSVAENLRISTPRKCSDREVRMREVYDLFPILEQRHAQIAGTLSGGEQQMVAIGRALMAKPRFLLLDEPSFGLSPIVFERLLEAISRINQTNVGILLAEQNSERALEISHRCYILENGRVAGSGKSEELVNDPSIKAAYLGV